MDIHKPKPVHNLREFAVEILTIVVGVVIAISLEQTVEYFHWRHEVAAGRESLNAEMTTNNAVFAFRIMTAPCIDRQLNEADSAIRAAAAGHWTAPRTKHWVGPDFMLLNSAWQSEQSAQVLTHFPRAELATLSQYYSQVPVFYDWEHQELNAWAGLNVLGDNPGPADLAQLRLNLYNARYLEFLILLNARQQLEWSEKLGIKYVEPPRSQYHCAPGEKLAPVRL
jgi:hypothetical protein